MVFALVSIALGAPPPTGFTTSIERVALERTAARVEATVNPVVRTIVLTGAKLAPRAESQLCPEQLKRSGSFTLRCSTRRLWAAVAEDEKGLYLDVRALRGVTWTWDGQVIPLQQWPFDGVAIPQTCPGTIDVVRAECALGEGRFEDAERLFTAALDSPDAHLARLRLGDLTLRRGNPEGALALYAKAAATGPVSRLAKLRECDLTGNCLTEKPATLDGLHPALAMEGRLHLIRQDLAVNRDREAMQQLVAEVEAGRPVCTTSRVFCQQAVQTALESGDDVAATMALSVFAQAALSDGPWGVEVAKAAATEAERAGAPAYAAAVLASLSGRLPNDELDQHLQRVARLYLAARDPVRAQFVVEYAEQRLPGAALRSASWQQLRRLVEPRSPRAPKKQEPSAPPLAERLPALSEDVAISSELAHAARLRAVAAQPPPPGVQP